MTSVRHPSSKVFDDAGALDWRRRAAGPVVFTNGVFDLLHRGHLDVLHAARSEGATLIVAVNADASVRRLKGPTRPVRGEAERALLVAALEMVDAVVVFADDTPLRLIELLQPDVLVKGGDYTEATVVGAAETRARGGRVVIVPVTPGHSTTSTIASLRDSSSP